MIPIFIWFVPIIVAVVSFLVGLFIVGLTKLPGKKIAILGMKGAGKTRLLNFLQQKPYVEYGTMEDAYSEFIYTKQDGSQIKIHKGIDIGGEERHIPEYYKKWLEESDRSIIFVFDLYQYNNDEQYRDNTNARFDYINRYFKGEKDKDICVLSSHIDLFGKDAQKAVNKFKEYIEKKEYANLILRNYSPVNMTDDEMLRKIEDQILK